MQKSISLGRKSLSILLAVLMLVTCIPIVSAPIAFAASSNYEVFNNVTLGPIIYTHGTSNYSHVDWTSAQHDYMMNGTRIADATYPGEASTSISVSSAKGVSSIEAYTTSMSKITTANIYYNNGVLKGDFGSGLGTPTTSSPKTVILKFNFSDGTYEFHERPVFTNPVAKNTVVGIYGRDEFNLNQRAKVFEVLAKGSYGSVSESAQAGGNSSYGGLFWYDNEFGNEKSHEVHVGNRNYASMYSPYNTVMDAWRSGQTWGVAGDVDPDIYVDSLTDVPLSADKNPGYYGLYAYKRNASRDIVVKTAHPAVYYLDISTNNNYGITNNGPQYSVDLFVGNLYFTWDDDDIQHTNLDGANVLVSSNSVNGVSLDTNSAKLRLDLDSETKYDLYLKGSAVAGETIDAEVQVRHSEENNDHAALAGINTKVQIIVTDKSEGRYAYDLAASTLSSIREQCYTPESWVAARTALLNMERWICNNTDTSSPDALISALEAAVEGLTPSDNLNDHQMDPIRTINATCTEPSTEFYACRYCGLENSTHDVAALNHDYRETVVAPTCTEDGYTEMKCDRCSDSYIVDGSIVPALTHNWEPSGHADATCEVNGYDAYECSRCHDTREDIIPATDHDYDVNDDGVVDENDGVVTTEPTCTETGIRTYTCQKDPRHTYTEVIPAKGHTETVVPAVQATCRSTGLTEGLVCTDPNCPLLRDESTTVTINDVENGFDGDYGLLQAQRRTIGTHKYVGINVVTGEEQDYVSNHDATCAVDGTKTSYCIYNCGTQNTIVDVGSKNSVAHTEAEAVRENEVAATCVDAGSYDEVVYCSVCGIELSRTSKSIEATGVHNYEAETSDATCTVPGTVTYTCSVCGDNYTETGALAPHVLFPSMRAKEPTCTEAGWTEELMCSVCLTVQQNSVEIPALNHEGYQTVLPSVPTCTEPGSLGYVYCPLCKKYFTDATFATETTPEERVIPANDHTPFESAAAIPATCIEEGMTAEIKCEDCGEILQERTIIDPLGHAETVTITAVPATCTEAGNTAEISCSRCYVVIQESETIPAKGHRAKKIPAVAPTCIEDGTTEGSVCWDCFVEGTDYTDETVTGVLVAVKVDPATGHDWGKGRVTTAPTCQAAGVRTFTCSKCSLTKTEEIPATDHDYSVLVSPKVSNSCEQDGTTAVYKCATCDLTTGGDPIPAYNHDYVEYTIPATCTSDGYTQKTCKRCREQIRTDIVEKFDHKYDNGDSAVVAVSTVTETPTCQEAGSMHIDYVCQRCGRTISEEDTEIPTVEHEISAEPTIENNVDPDCRTETDGGYDNVYYCIYDCGYEFEDAREHVTVPWAHTAGVEKTEVEDSRVDPIHNQNEFTDGHYDIASFCTKCGDEIPGTRETVPIPAVHTPSAEKTEVPDSRVEPIHTQDELVDGHYDIAKFCTECGVEIPDTRETVTIPVDHAYGEPEKTNNNLADCALGGSYDLVYTCSECGKIETEHVTVDPTDHVRGETFYENEIAPTCTEKGSKDRVIKCAVCGIEISRKTIYTDPALGHDFDETITENIQVINATCTDPKMTVVKCSRCDETKTLTTQGSALGHIEGEAVVENEIPATCSEDGSYESVIYCSREINGVVCGAELSRRTVRVPSNGHHDDDDDGHCDDCGEVFCEHDTTTLVGASEASCITRTNGYTGDEICDICGEIVTPGAVIPWSHTIEIDPAVESTCTSTGLTAGSHCSICGMVFDVQRTVPKKEHIQVTIPGTPATCSTPGTSDAVVCATCGLVITEHKIINTTTKHVDNDGDGNCDNCGKSMSGNCNCLCHKKSWISRTFYKFILFFWKLFRISKTCDCGAVHY